MPCLGTEEAVPEGDLGEEPCLGLDAVGQPCFALGVEAEHPSHNGLSHYLPKAHWPLPPLGPMPCHLSLPASP